MGVGSLNGRTFRLDPESIAYHFDIKASATNTVGGRVVQVFGTRISDLIVTGSFGVGSWEEQQQFLSDIITDMQGQEGQLGPNGFYGGSQPIVFSYPPRNWNFDVYLLQYTQPGGSFSVVLDNEIINPQWTLDMFIVNDNGGLVAETNTALTSYLNRLANGIGWTLNAYNNVTTNNNANTPAPAPKIGDDIGRDITH